MNLKLFAGLKILEKLNDKAVWNFTHVLLFLSITVISMRHKDSRSDIIQDLLLLYNIDYKNSYLFKKIT